MYPHLPAKLADPLQPIFDHINSLLLESGSGAAPVGHRTSSSSLKVKKREAKKVASPTM